VPRDSAVAAGPHGVVSSTNTVPQAEHVQPWRMQAITAADRARASATGKLAQVPWRFQKWRRFRTWRRAGDNRSSRHSIHCDTHRGGAGQRCRHSNPQFVWTSGATHGYSTPAGGAQTQNFLQELHGPISS